MEPQTKNFYHSQAWKRKRATILRRDKYLCQVSKRYGQMVEARTVHHIYPLEEHPEYALCDWNLISVGDAVNNQLHDRLTGKLTPIGLDLMHRTRIPGKAAAESSLTLVCGLPGSGKTTWVKEHMKSGDIVYDLDYLCSAFTYGPVHGRHEDMLARFVNGFLRPVVKAHQRSGLGKLYVIRAIPNDEDYTFLRTQGADVHTCDTAPDICRERLIARDGTVSGDFEQIVRRWRKFCAALSPPPP